ncbi:hypothetical protein I6N96_12595 [Enterococcus sp. BWM-S5]|uniref:YopX protein domain-containing protein n=1 Tax=Enterococcus larvae TaxID=2794352 RepID=A0ABS4CLF4_9ENTE|nr:hypothetical protein [Enterococcus larvae]MBP1047112.1 hypothetical protein [Enterococcus larvae]
MNIEKYKNCVEEVKDKHGKVIKYHDVCRLSNGEMLLIEKGFNHRHKTTGLTANNDFIGLRDWLDVYPDGELEIVGNVDFVADADFPEVGEVK